LSEQYRKRRCIVPVDGFFEWRRSRGDHYLFSGDHYFIASTL